METDILGTIFQNMDKGLSAVLLVFFLIKLLPSINKMTETLEKLKESSDRRENQADQTQKDLIRLLERLKYEKKAP